MFVIHLTHLHAIANNEIIAVNNLLNFNHWPVWSLADKDGGGTVDDYLGHTEYAESQD